MNERLAQPTMITAIALATEGGLIALALLIASWWGRPELPWGHLEWKIAALPANLVAVGQGVLAVVPMLAMLLVIDRWPPRFLLPLKHSVDREIVPLFASSGLGEFALISIAAGIGEELFFRGLLQAGLAMELMSLDLPPGLEMWAMPLAIGAASVVFGVCHWLNREYAFLATLIGIYLGMVYVVTDNLLAPITAHALYDFIALWYLVIWKGRQVKPSWE